jgi:hypothetical protein
MRRLFPILLASFLPIAAQADCTAADLKGRWFTILAGEDTGIWQRCNVKITSTGLATSICQFQNGAVVAGDPVQLWVNADCSFTGQSQDGFNTYSGKIQKGKRGVIGRFLKGDGENSFDGPFVAAKRR